MTLSEIIVCFALLYFGIWPANLKSWKTWLILIALILHYPPIMHVLEDILRDKYYAHRQHEDRPTEPVRTVSMLCAEDPRENWLFAGTFDGKWIKPRFRFPHGFRPEDLPGSILALSEPTYVLPVRKSPTVIGSELATVEKRNTF